MTDNPCLRTASLQDLVDHPGLTLTERLLEKTQYLFKLYKAEEHLRRYGRRP